MDWPWFATMPETFAILALLAAMLGWEAYRIIRGGKTAYWPVYVIGVVVLAMWVEMLWRNGRL